MAIKPQLFLARKKVYKKAVDPQGHGYGPN